MLTQNCLSFLVKYRGTTYLQCCNYYHLPSNFSSKCQSPLTIFCHKLLTREGRDFGQWTNSSIIHDNICSLHPCGGHSIVKLNNHVRTLYMLRNPTFYIKHHQNGSNFYLLFAISRYTRYLLQSKKW